MDDGERSSSVIQRRHLRPNQLVLDATRTLYSKTNLRRRRQHSPHPQIPNRAILNLGQILRNFHINNTHRLRDPIHDLDLLVKVDGVQVAHGIVVQPDAVVVAGVFVQWVWAVGRRLAVEAEVDCLAGCYGGVVGDALVDVDAGVVALAPCC